MSQKCYEKSPCSNFDQDCLRLEAVTTCVGFDDLLDETIKHNHGHFDSFIVTTSHDDKATQRVCKKHGARCVQTDLFKKNGRNFNKGAAINAGLDHFQYHGWRMHLDADIILPANFRRILFNHSHLSRSTIYGADRIDVLGREHLREIMGGNPQHVHSCLTNASHGPIGARYVDVLRGYCPIGYFQLWHASSHKSYPYSLGGAQHDDVMFSAQWPESERKLIPSLLVYHLCSRKPVWGENWDGVRKHPRIS